MHELEALPVHGFSLEGHQRSSTPDQSALEYPLRPVPSPLVGHNREGFPLLIGQHKMLTAHPIYKGSCRQGKNTEARTHNPIIVISAGAT